MAIVQGTKMDEVVFNGIDLQYRHLVLDLEEDKKETASLKPTGKLDFSLEDISEYIAPVKNFIDIGQIKVPRQSGKPVKTELIKALADGIKRACIPRMLAEINRCGLYPIKTMRIVWNTHWSPEQFIVLGVRVGALTPNPKFRENGLLPSLPTLYMRMMISVNGTMITAFVKAYYNGSKDANGYPMIEVDPIDVDKYLDGMTIRLMPFEISAIGEDFFNNFKEAYQ